MKVLLYCLHRTGNLRFLHGHFSRSRVHKCFALEKGSSSRLLCLLVCQTETGIMDEVYQTSSIKKIQQLEQELAAQLAELKAERGDYRMLQGVPRRVYR